ncbi:flavodoxin [Heyndrickxia acidiproducens]|uniref:flavodoxin n=1 Tax=Heyndrickxia acidiproducens TaxID=1121084 RepID=UPI00036E3954|nr:flavodoxin [Heyndrickxia acidiproducens]
MVPKLRVLIAYLSYSGNTKETAELLESELRARNMEVDMHAIGTSPPVEPEQYDLILIGTFTWERGATPDEVKDFVLEIGYKPSNVAVFGTGDTQFGGDDLFCLAAVKLAKFYHSKWAPLKIEQSPRGSQEQEVEKWIEGVLHDAKINA